MARLSVVIAQSHSLKEKRMVLRRVKDRVRERAGIVMNEVGAQDTWQRAEPGCPVASPGRPHGVQPPRTANPAPLAGIVRRRVPLVRAPPGPPPLEATPAPYAPVDDRTGAGDKAVAAANDDDSTWIPAAWREEDAS